MRQHTQRELIYPGVEDSDIFYNYKPSPLECIFGHIPFLRRWDTVLRYSGIHLDTPRRYVRIQLDTVENSGVQWICCKIARYRSIQGHSGIPRIR